MRRLMLVLALLAAGACGDDDDALPKLAIGAADATREPAGDARAMLAPARPVRYEARGDLPSLRGPEPAYRLAAGDGRRATERLMEAFGLDGAAVETAFGWSATDGQRTIEVQRAGGLPWTFSAGKGDVAVASCAVEGEGCVEPPEPPRPDRAASEAAARNAFEGLGVEGRPDVTEGYGTWQFMVQPQINGRPAMGFETVLTIGEGVEVQFAHGWAAAGTEELGEYPLIGTDEGIRRLNEGGGGFGGPEPLVAEDASGGGASGSAGSAGQTEPGSAEPLEPTPEPQPQPEPEPEVIGLTAARLVLIATGGYLVPAYAFTTEQDQELTVIAVTDGYLDQVQPGPDAGGSTGATEPAPLPPKGDPESVPGAPPSAD